jgi:hypothetical protein
MIFKVMEASARHLHLHCCALLERTLAVETTQRIYPMNLIKSAIIGTLTAALAVFALSGFAGETGETVESEAMDKPAFEELDANIDGVITADEAQETWLAAVFQDVDQDKDGVINRSEYDTAASAS